MYKSKWLVAAAITGAWLAGHHAHAATITTLAPEGDRKAWFIAIDGEILPNDDLKFKREVIKHKINDAVVFLSSPGGQMFAGLDIGRQIRNNGFTTYVPENLYCASMCSNIWLAGNPRYASSSAHIGFHSMATVKQNKNGSVKRDKNGDAVIVKASPEGNATVAEYYRWLGLNKATSEYLLSAGPNDVTWLNGVKAKELGINWVLVKDEEKDAKTPSKAETEQEKNSYPGVGLPGWMDSPTWNPTW